MNVEIKIADRPDEFEQLHRINHRVYAAELGQDRVDPETGKLVDRMLDRNVWFVAKVGDEVVGMLGLTPPDQRFSLEDALTESDLLDRHRHQAVELRRLAVLPEHRGRGIFFRLVDFVASWCVPRGYHYGFISGIAQRVADYERIGFRKFGTPFTKGACTYQPMVLSLQRLVARLDADRAPNLDRALAGGAP